MKPSDFLSMENLTPPFIPAFFSEEKSTVELEIGCEIKVFLSETVTV